MERRAKCLQPSHAFDARHFRQDNADHRHIWRRQRDVLERVLGIGMNAHQPKSRRTADQDCQTAAQSGVVLDDAHFDVHAMSLPVAASRRIVPIETDNFAVGSKVVMIRRAENIARRESAA